MAGRSLSVIPKFSDCKKTYETALPSAHRLFRPSCWAHLTCRSAASNKSPTPGSSLYSIERRQAQYHVSNLVVRCLQVLTSRLQHFRISSRRADSADTFNYIGVLFHLVFCMGDQS